MRTSRSGRAGVVVHGLYERLVRRRQGHVVGLPEQQLPRAQPLGFPPGVLLIAADPRPHFAVQTANPIETLIDQIRGR